MGVVQLKTNLRLFEAITIIIGSMIGSGILRLPGNMAETLHSPKLILLAWLVGAVLTVVGALVFAEMAAMYPKAGGQYHFLKEGLGPFWSYQFGWAMFWVIMPGIVAGVALAFADFLGGLLGEGGLPGERTNLFTFSVGSSSGSIDLPAWGNAYVAIAVILFLALLNYLSTKYGGVISNYTVIGKYVGLAALVGFIFVLGNSPGDAYQALDEPLVLEDGETYGPQSGITLFLAFGAAMAATLFAFDGWPQATYVASEIQNPKRNLPRALLFGPLITAVIYIALTAAYFYVIPIDQAVAIGHDGEARIAVDAARAAWGEGLATFISIVALVSVFGTVNAYVLTSPRIFYAMAKDGALLKGMAKLSEKRATPAFALLMFALWSCMLVMSGAYFQITKMVVYGLWLLYIPTAIAHMRLRKVRPDLERPFKTPLYPVLPIVFLLASVFVVYISWFDPEHPASLNRDWIYTAAASAIMLIGIPFYFLQKRNPAAHDEVTDTGHIA
ncbi:MAG: amino acid permease [Candidatus Thermoplasmatota archaeon]